MSEPVHHLLGNVTRYPVVLSHGRGVWLWDEDGNEYLDLLAGIAVCVLGHAHPDLVEAISRQAGAVTHASPFFYTRAAIDAADAIVSRLGPGRVFFCNSGAEANEAAIKLARKRAWRAGETDRVEIVSLEGGFHGRTFGALAATMQPSKWEGFQPLPAGFVGIPPDDLDALDAAVTGRTAAVIVEPLLGEGGIVPLKPEFLRAARELTASRGALLVLDEIQTGMGRTGRWWGFEHAGIAPDVVTLAKGLGGGVPVGAMWMREDLTEVLRPGDHGTTYGGNALVCAAVKTVFDVIERDGLVDRAAKVGEVLRSALEAAGLSVRGQGLLLAVPLGAPKAAEVTQAALERGLIVNNVVPDAIRLAPALILSEEEAAEGVRRLVSAIEAVFN